VKPTPTPLNSSCVENSWIFSSIINSTSYNITEACKLPHDDSSNFNKSLFFGLAIGLSFFFAVLLSFVNPKGPAEALLISRLRSIPAYEMHQKLEDMHAERLKGMEKDLYKSNWKGRYINIKWSEDRSEKLRTIVIVEDMRKTPPMWWEYEKEPVRRNTRSCSPPRRAPLANHPSPMPLNPSR
jgi:hypothetical protein